MPRHVSAPIVWTQYLAARFAVMGLASFPVDMTLETAGAIGRLLPLVDKRHYHRALAHLGMCFPEWTESKRDRVARASFEHFMQLLAEIIYTPRIIHSDSWPSRTKLGNLGEAIEHFNAGKPAILVTGHLGNFEVIGCLLSVLGYPCDAIARPIDNPLVNSWLLGMREKSGLRIITKWDATDRMLGVLNSGGTLGFIADQNAGDKGMFVPFFGKLASTYKSIGLLAINQEVPVICGYARRIGPGFRYELSIGDFIRPEEWKSQPDPLYYVTARYIRAIETMIRQEPNQYFWMHRRWKSRPKFERDAKPFPTALQKTLEGLPWMTPALMASLREPVVTPR